MEPLRREGCELEAGVGEALTEADAMMVAPSRALASHAIIATADSNLDEDFSYLFVALNPTKATARSK
jgi:hypothetical protein